MNKEEIIEYLQEKNIEIKSSSSSIQKMIKLFVESGSLNANKFFKNLKVKRDGIDANISTLLNLINDDQKLISFFDGDSTSDILIKILSMIADDKKAKSDQFTIKKRLDVENLANTEYKEVIVDGQKYIFEPINIFETITNVKPNNEDRDFYSCFKISNKNVLFTTGKETKIIFQKENGALDFNNELNTYSSDENQALISQLNKAFGIKYCNYIQILKVILTGITKEDLANASEDQVALIEDIFMNGYDIAGEHCSIPSSFRKFIEVVIRYKISEAADGKQYKFFDGFSIRPKDKKILPSFEFDDFLDYFSKYFQKLTKGCIGYINEWKTYSNSLKDCSLCYYPLPQDLDEIKTIPLPWAKWFFGNDLKHPKASTRILNRVFCFIGMCIDASNHSQQMLLIADQGGTGKGETIRLLQQILPKGMMKNFPNTAINNPRFGVTSHSAYSAHILYNTEYDGKNINSELMKAITGGDTISCEVKNGADIEWNTEGTKLIFTSNRRCQLTEHAIRRRIIPVSFEANFDFRKGFTKEFKDELIKTGKDFLSFCYKMYINNPYKNSHGDYLVMNPEQEAEFKKTGYYPLTSEEKNTFLLKAFSKDEELGDQFYSGDFDAGHMNDDLNDIYDKLFEFDNKSVVKVSDFKDYIEENFMECSNTEMMRLRESFDFHRDPQTGDLYLGSMKSTNNSRFIAFMEKTKGHEYNKVKHIGGETVRVVTNLRLKLRDEEEKNTRNQLKMMERETDNKIKERMNNWETDPNVGKSTEKDNEMINDILNYFDENKSEENEK